MTLLEHLQHDFPHLRFVQEQTFTWTPTQRTIRHAPLQTAADHAQLLHEVAHAVLNHTSYDTDIQLIDMERQAWEYAVHHLAPRYDMAMTMDDAIVQSSLDSYRDWLHRRSTCPTCSAVGIEQSWHTYRCLQCTRVWRVNEARTCRLRRYRAH